MNPFNFNNLKKSSPIRSDHSRSVFAMLIQMGLCLLSQWIVPLCLMLSFIVTATIPKDAFAAAPWYDSNWIKRKSILVDSSKVNSDLTNFPMLINLSADAEIASGAQADADDIVFTSGDGTTQLDHEIESYNSGTGALTAWVEVPTVTSATDTEIFIYYQNPVAANQENVDGTWSANYKAVWHMAEDPSISTDGDCGGATEEACDSTSNDQDGEMVGTMLTADLITGQINGALDMDGVDDYINIADSGTLDITDDLTLSAWIKPGVQAAGAFGDISNTATDGIVFGDVEVNDTEIIQVSGDIYAVVYSASTNDGYVATVEIDSSGDIKSGRVIDWLEFDASQGLFPEIVHVSGDMFAVVYSGESNDGYISTLTISTSGEISDSLISSYEFAANQGYTPKIVELSSGIFAIVFNGLSQDSDLVTVSIDGVGNISAIDQLVFGDITAYEPEIINISGDIYAIVYRGSSNDGYVSTIQISATGDISGGVILDTIEFFEFDIGDPEIINVSGNIYAIVHEGETDGWVTTIEINSAGSITDSIIDNFEFDTTYANAPKISNVVGDHFLIVYDTNANTENMATITIDSSGNIGASVTDRATFADIQALYPEAINISGDIYAVVYSSESNDGYVSTIDISTGGIIDSGNIIDALEFETVQGLNPEIVNVSGSTYAIAYRGTGTTAVVVTIDIDASGNISNSVIDSYTFEAGYGVDPKIVAVSGSIFAIAFDGTTAGHDLVTISIAADGTITKSLIDSMVFADVQAYEPEIINVSGDIYAIVFRGSGSDGYLATIDISSSGDIAEGVILDIIEYDTSAGFNPEIINISGDIFAITYTGGGNDGFLITVDIDSTGDITPALVDSFEFDTANGTFTKIIPISGDIYAIVYAGSGNDGFVITVDIDSAGNIAGAVVDSLEYNTAQGTYPDIIPIAGDVYAIAFASSSNDGFIATVDIDSAGNIAGAVIDSYEYDTSQGLYASFIPVSGDIYAIAYSGSGNDGFIATVDIDSAGNITPAVVDSWEFNTVLGLTPKIMEVSGTIHAIVFEGNGSDGFVATLPIANDGTITKTFIDSMEFDAVQGDFPELFNISGNIYAIPFSSDGVARMVTVDIDSSGNIADTIVDKSGYGLGLIQSDIDPMFKKISGDIYAVAYGGVSNDGMIKTIEINSSGIIVDAFVDAIEFDRAQALDPDFDNITGDIFGLVYRGSGNDGFMATVEISTSGTIAPEVIENWEFDPGDVSFPRIIGVSSNTVAVTHEDSDNDGQLISVTVAADGNITTAAVDSLEYDVFNGDTPSIINISGDIFAIFYTQVHQGRVNTVDIDSTGVIENNFVDKGGFGYGLFHSDTLPELYKLSSGVFAVIYGSVSSDGIVKTVEVDSSGMFVDAFIDSLEFNNLNGTNGYMINLSGDYFSIFHRGTGNFGSIATLEIATDGIITQSIIDAWDFTATTTLYNKMITVSGTTKAVVYEDIDGDGQLATMTISNTGVITKALIDTLEYEEVDGDMPDIIGVGGDYYAIPYSKAAVARLATVDIDASGNIGASVTEISDYGYGSVHIDATPNIINISGNIYAIVFGGTSNDGVVKTVEIDSSGNVIDGFVDFFEFDTVQGLNPEIVNVSGDIYAIVYRGSGNAATLVTLDIGTNGTINKSVVDSWVFDSPTSATALTKIVKVSGTTFALVYEDLTGDGQLATVTISAAGAITKAFVDTQEYDTEDADEPEIYNISGDIYAIAYSKAGPGRMHTFDISAAGTITNVPVDSGSFAAAGFTNDTAPVLINISGDIYAAVYSGFGSDGVLKTFEVDSSGTVIDGEIDNYEFNGTFASEADIINVSGDIYAVVYRGEDDDGFVVTVDIATDGTITKSIVDSWEFDMTQALTPQILKISGTTYAIVYEDSSGDGQVFTLDISNAGTITQSIIDSLEYDIGDADEPDFINISGDIYAIAYQGVSGDGYVVTLDIDAAGNISNTVLDSFVFDAADANNPEMINVAGDIYAIVYDGTGSDGFIVTVDIDIAGSITAAVVDSLEYQTIQGITPSIVGLTNDVFAIAYRGTGDDGFLTTVTITTAGSISGAVLDTLEFDTASGFTPYMLSLAPDTVMVAYNSVSNYDLQTIKIVTDTNRGIYKGDAYKIDSNTDTVYATINSTTISSPSTVPGSGWEFVTLTYDNDSGANQMQLYLSGTLATTGALTADINTNATDLNIAELFVGQVDEVRISDTTVLDADWIEAEYWNQSDPDNFYSLGPERTEGIKTWGGGSNVPPDGLWSTNQNWTGDAKPISTDIVNFDNTALDDCTIDENVDMLALDISSNYTGEISQGSFMVTVGTAGFNQTGGTFTGGTGSIDVNGDFSATNATFTATSGTMHIAEDLVLNGTTTFNHNGGTLRMESDGNVSFTTNSSVFYNLEFHKTLGVSGTMSLVDDFVVDGTLSIDKTDVDDYSILPNGTRIISLYGGFAQNNTSAVDSITFGDTNLTLNFTGTLNQNINYVTGTLGAIFEVTKMSGSGDVILINDFVSLGSSATATVVEGTFNLNGNNFTSGGNFTIEDGGVLELLGNENSKEPTFNSSSKARYLGTTAGETIEAWTYDELIVNGSGGTFTLEGNSVVNDNMTVLDGSVVTDGYDINITGTLDVNTTLNTVNGAGGNSTVFVGGDWDMTGATFISTNSTVMLTGTSTGLRVTSNSNAFDDLIINDGMVGYWKLDESFSPAKDSSGYGHDGTWNGSPNPDTSEIPTLKFKNPQSLEFDGALDYIDLGDDPDYRGMRELTVAVWVRQSAASYIQAVVGYWGSTTPINGRKYLLRINNSDIQGYVYTDEPNQEGGTFSTTDLTDGWHHLALIWNGTTLSMYIDGVVSPTTYSGNGSINNTSTNNLFIGNEQGSSGLPFNGFIDDVRIYRRALSSGEISLLAGGDHPETAQGVYTLQDDLTVSGTLTLNTGGLNVGSNQLISIAGDWENNGGQFIENTGTVTMTGGDQEITGSETFYNLQKSVATTGTLTLGKDAVITTIGTLTLNGAAGNLLNIRSTTEGVKGQIDPQGGRTISYLDVMDNENIDVTVVDCTNNCVDSGDNIQWDFGGGLNTVSGTLYLDEGINPLTSKTVSMSINGAPSSLFSVSDGITGAYTLSYTASSVSAGDVLTLYIDGETEKGVTVTVSDGNSLTGIDVYQNYLLLRHDNGGSLTNTELAIADDNGDSDISDIFSLEGTRLTVNDGYETLIPNGFTFAPGNLLNVSALDIDGTLNIGSGSVFVSGDWDSTTGTFSNVTSTIIFTGTLGPTITTAGRSFNDLVFNNSLRLYYEFEETSSPSIDTSGYRSSGIWGGGATSSTDIPSLQFANDRSIVFDGDDDYVDVLDSMAGNHDFEEIGNNNDYTLSVWINTTGGTGGGTGWTPNDVIMELRTEGTTGSKVPFSFGIESNVLSLGRTSAYTSFDEREVGTVAVNDGNWHHVAAVVSGNIVDFYVDGVLDVSRTFVTAIGNTSVGSATANLQFGVASTNSGFKSLYDFNGMMDDARIYTRALNATEIANVASGDNDGNSSGTFTLNDSLDINGDLYLFDGTFAAGANTINLDGDWVDKGGTLGGTSTVILDGVNQEIPASANFYNLTKTTTSVDVLYFGENATITIANAVSFTGSSGNEMLLRSLDNGTQWMIDPQGTRTVLYLNVQDSNNININSINASGGTNIDSGNNINWFFRGPLKGAIMVVE